MCQSKIVCVHLTSFLRLRDNLCGTWDYLCPAFIEPPVDLIMLISFVYFTCFEFVI